MLFLIYKKNYEEYLCINKSTNLNKLLLEIR